MNKLTGGGGVWQNWKTLLEVPSTGGHGLHQMAHQHNATLSFYGQRRPRAYNGTASHSQHQDQQPCLHAAAAICYHQTYRIQHPPTSPGHTHYYSSKSGTGSGLQTVEQLRKLLALLHFPHIFLPPLHQLLWDDHVFTCVSRMMGHGAWPEVPRLSLRKSFPETPGPGNCTLNTSLGNPSSGAPGTRF